MMNREWVGLLLGWHRVGEGVHGVWDIRLDRTRGNAHVCHPLLLLVMLLHG